MPAAKKGRKTARGAKKEASVEPECDAYTYERQEVVLCYHGPQLYKAKVVKRTVKKLDATSGTDQVLYFVHYHGWNQQWDEWVTGQRCLKYNAENLEIQRNVKATMDAANSAETTTTTATAVKPKPKVTKKAKTKEPSKRKNKRKRQIEDSDDSDSTAATATEKVDKKLESLIAKQRKLRRKDLDDLELNQTIKIRRHQNQLRQQQTQQSDTQNTNANTVTVTKRATSRPSRNSRQRTNRPSVCSDGDAARRRFKEKLKTITIPTALKDSLVAQYQLIHYDEKLIALPKEKGLRINDILEDALQQQKQRVEAKRNSDNSDDFKSAVAVCQRLPFLNDGIRGFFKNTLSLNLLYNFEKPQLAVLQRQRGDAMDACDVYGAEHLIRLFYVLPNILIHTQGVTEQNFGVIKQCVSILIQFLSKNRAKYLINFADASKMEKQVLSVDAAYLAEVKQIVKAYDDKKGK